MRSQELDAVFSALAHPERRRMLDLLQKVPGMTIAALTRNFDMSGVGVLKHVQLLESCGLIHSQRVGRERHLYFNVMPIQAVYDRWTDDYSQFWAGRLADLKERLESRSHSKTQRMKKRA